MCATPPDTRLNLTAPGLAMVVALLGSLACSDSTLKGTWSGSNARYTRVVLNLTEIGDSLTGAVDVTPSSGSHFGAILSGEHLNDSVYLRGDPLPPSAGGGFGTTFAGARTFRGFLAGCLSAREQPCSQVVLHR